MISLPETFSQRPQISSTGLSKFSTKTTSGSFSMPTSPGYFTARPLFPSAIGGVGRGSTAGTVDAWRTSEDCRAATRNRTIALMFDLPMLHRLKDDPHPSWPGIAGYCLLPNA